MYIGCNMQYVAKVIMTQETNKNQECFTELAYYSEIEVCISNKRKNQFH